ncbi:hypothetical protein RSJ42_05465 [Methanosarcina hadiensis]|uniref:hypothetical protein n=1 Tax=Methanosarcina hadiensis TaxID=3078083 RepID=UPI0039773461
MGTQNIEPEDRNTGEVLGLRDEIGKIQEAIADFEVGKRLNVAIIAGLLGGKTTLVNEIERLNINRATKIVFSGIVRDKKEIFLPEDIERVILFDNCHFLYTRKPGGFDILYEFLDMISSRKRIFVTTWNMYSWNYLNQTFGLGKYFPVQVIVPSFERENLKILTLKRYKKNEIIFDTDKEFEEKSPLYVAEYPLEIASLGRTFGIPVLKINIPYLKNRFLNKKKERKEEQEKEAVEYQVFEKIFLESKGNPGIAMRIWELGLDYPYMKPENIGSFSYDIELEDEEAYVLNLILSYQGLNKTEIADIIGSMLRTNEAIFRLFNQELIFEREDGSFRVRPEALRSVIAYLEKLRLVW